MKKEPFTEYDALRYAITEASRSPCAKSQRGVVIFNEEGLLAKGFNHPPPPFACGRDDGCREQCNRVCVHAEQAALVQYQGDGGPRPSMIHVEAVEGDAVPSGGPSCWQCSRLILLVPRLVGIWLLHEDGLRLYDPLTFHRETLRTCNLPVTENPQGHVPKRIESERK